MEKKKGRRSYLSDYRLNKQGVYEYGGRRYSYQGTGEQLRRGRRLLAALCAGMAASMLLAGCVPAPGMRGCVYVLLPYAVGLASGGAACLALYHLCTGGDPMKEHTFEISVRKLPGRAALAAACSGLASAGEIICVLRGGLEGKAAGFAAFLVLELTASAAAALVFKIMHKMRWS